MALNTDLRPDPDLLLARVQEEERQKHRGKLKIFLGYAAGVGKTYEMLKAGHLRRQEGIDVRIGYVETHGRPETDALLEGLATIPMKMVEYPGRHPPGAGPRPCSLCVPAARPRRRTRPYQRPWLAAPETVPGRRGDPGRRYRCLHHPEYPAPREPERRHRPGDRGNGERDYS